MDEVQRLRLQQRRRANQQYQATKQLLATVTPAIGALLREAPKQYFPEDEPLRESWFWPNHQHATDGWYQGADRPVDYRHQRFAWIRNLTDALGDVPQMPDTLPAYLWLGAAYPLFLVSFGETLPCLLSLARNNQYHAGLVAADHSVGLLLSTYVGYLNDDINPDELVYELSTWGFPKRT